MGKHENLTCGKISQHNIENKLKTQNREKSRPGKKDKDWDLKKKIFGAFGSLYGKVVFKKSKFMYMSSNTP